MAIHGHRWSSCIVMHGHARAMPRTAMVMRIVITWQCHGNAMVIAIPWSPMVTHGNAMVMPWQCHGHAMAMPWSCHGNAMVIHSHTMASPRVTMAIHAHCHVVMRGNAMAILPWSFMIMPWSCMALSWPSVAITWPSMSIPWSSMVTP